MPQHYGILLPLPQAATWLGDAVPGSFCRVSNAGEVMDHERLLLWPAFGVKARSDRRAFWWVRSSDDDEWVEDISGNDPQNGPSVSASGTWTRRMARRSSPLLIPITCRVAQLGDLYQTGTTNSVNSGVPVLTRETYMTREGELKHCSPTITGELLLG